MKRLSTLIYLLTIVLSGAVMAGCDALAGALGVDKVDVPLSGAGSFNVTGGQLTVNSTTSERSGGKLPNLFDIKSVDIPTSKVHFTATSGKNGEAAATGNVYVTVFIGGYPFVSGTIAIANNVVTNVTPSLYTVATQIASRCSAANSGCPSASAYSGKSASQLADLVETYLRTKENLDVSIAMTADPGVNGTVTIDGFTINLDF